MLHGRDYNRVSVSRWGQSTSPDEQGTENRADAEREGNTLGESYVDEGRSASRYATKKRSGFDRLMSDLETGNFGADFLQLWEPSRGSRRMDEWVRLLGLLEEHGILVRVTTHGRMYDPRNPRDRRSLLEDAVDSEYESGKTSKRVARSTAQAAERGRPHGVAPYGYRRVYDERTGRLITQEPHPVEAPIVRELFGRLRRGHSMHAIALDFETRGIRNGRGTSFGLSQLREMALNPAYAALRVHVAEKNIKNRYHHPGARITPAGWDAIVPESMFLAVNRKLMSRTHPLGERFRPGRALHWLTTMSRCAECGGPLSIGAERGARTAKYRCTRKGCVAISEAELDEVVQEMLMEYLERDDIMERLLEADEEASSELSKLETEIERLNKEIREMSRGVREGRVSMAFVMETEPGMREAIQVAEKRRQKLATPAAIRDFLEPDVRIRDAWTRFPLSARRELARLVFNPDLAGQITIKRRPPGKGGRARVSAAERIQLAFADQSGQ